jgi:hypothetical protein
MPEMRDRTARLFMRLSLAAMLASSLLFAAPAGAQQDIIPQPNSGSEPQSAGDPGGWLQVSLFFLLCGVVGGIAALVWRQSARARARRREAGLDPVAVARAAGRGVRTTTSTPDGDQSTRRSTRNDPVAETSANLPDRNAGR